MRCTRPVQSGKFGVGLVPCGRCMACRIQKCGEWQTRIHCEKMYMGDCSFLTLTYSDENLPPDLSLNKKHLQDFIKRLRWHLSEKGVKIKHYSVGEYGDLTKRPHYHSLILGWYPEETLVTSLSGAKKTRFSSMLVCELWPYGFNMVGNVEQKSIDYVTGYVRKKLYGKRADEEYKGLVAPFLLCSKGIGKRYALDHRDEILKNEGVVINGRNHGINRYFWKLLELDDDYLNKIMSKRQHNIDVEVMVRGLSDNYDYQDKKQREANLLAKEKLFNRGML